MRKQILAVGVLAAICPGIAAAQQAVMSNFSYDYMEARIGVSPVTYGAALSKSIHPNAHIIASIDSEFESDVDMAAGVGFHAPVNNWADIFGEMKLRMINNDGTKSTGEWGMEINLGVRQWLGPQLEVGGQLGHANIDNIDHTFGIISGRFHATELFSIGLDGRFNYTYGDQIMVSTRFRF